MRGAPEAPGCAAAARAAVEAALGQALPGAAAQLDMAPAYRLYPGMDPGIPPEGERVREASVLILLYPLGPSLSFPLIERPSGSRRHGGQMALPGGARETGESDEAAALREAAEEIGVDPAMVDIAGALSPLYVPPSSFLVRPFVGFARERPRFALDSAEAASLVEPGLGELLDPSSRRLAERRMDGRTWSVPCFMLAGREVWGATAMILAELAEALSRVAPAWARAARA